MCYRRAEGEKAHAGMKRREFITLLGGAASWPLTALAQQAMPVVGFLHPGSSDLQAYLAVAFREGLKEAGYVETKNVIIEYRWANGHYDQLQALAVDLVRRRVAVIAATGGTVSAQAAKAATATIPIVFNVGVDPIKAGLVTSFNRPGGNITGVNTQSPVLEPKRLGLLRELVPQAATIGVLLNPRNPDVDFQREGIETAATAIGVKLRIFHPNREDDLDRAFAALVQERTDALLVGNDAFFVNQREQIVALAARHGLPAIYTFRSFAEAGGLMSYSTSLVDVYWQVGFYVGRILKGEKPADLPVVQPTKFELVINLKTAKALGVMISDNLLSIADEVIE
jgi:putative tryptophan/tyrosine transport system substrate-binding protein